MAPRLSNGAGLRVDDLAAFARGVAEKEWETSGQSTIAQGQPKADNRVTFADLRIRTKDRKIIPFEPNAVQIKYLDEICPRWREGIFNVAGLRELILKARQFGFSTLILAIFFILTINEPNTQTVVVAHDTESTERLFRIIDRFYKNLPAEKKPPTKYANRREFLWPGLDSYFFVGTAGSGQFGRGGTVNYVHASEVAFWPDAEELVAGLFEAVPADGCIFQESTANGFGNYYQTEFEAAQFGDSSYKDRFFAWFENPEYRLPLDQPLEPATDPKEAKREEILREVHGCDEEQINWRRKKRKALKSKFPQEYPSTPREAFIVSGNKYFDVESLEALETSISQCKPIQISAPDTGGLLKKHWDKIEIFAAPESGRTYIVSADTAEGLDDSGVADFDCADVLDAETWEQVAHVHGSWDTHKYGLLLAELGFWYNTALLGIERNNHGHAVINAALYSGGYPEMKQGECHGMYLHEEYDENKVITNRKPGWPTTPKTKYFALDGLAASIETRDIKIRSKHTLAELMNFLKLPRGKAGAPPGAHDDAVMSLSIGDALLKLGLKRRVDTHKSAIEALKLLAQRT